MRAVCAILAAALALAAFASQADYSVTGTVRNSVTGEPVKGAMVILVKTPEPGDAPGQPEMHSIMAGASGEFSFTGLAKGQYALGAQKPGFVEDDGSSISVPSSDGPASIKLAPLGTIEGTIVNQYGDPLNEVPVVLLRYAIDDGERTLSVAGSKVTNDLGKFRFWDVTPGKYYVKARNRAGLVYYVSDQAIGDESPESFRPIYFGGAAEIQFATPITVETGAQARADFKLRMETAYTIRGVLQNCDSPQQVFFEMFQGEEKLGTSRATVNSVDRRFEIGGVLPGLYTLRAMEGAEGRGEVAVAVKGGDVNGVSLALSPPLAVTATTHISGQPPETPVRRGGCEIFLHTADQFFPVPPGLVFPGQYAVRFTCRGAYVESAVSGTTDLLADTTLTVHPGTAPPPIEINVKYGGGSVRAKLPTPPSREAPGLLLVPQSHPARPLMILSFDDSDDSLEFKADNLAPGDYLAYAIADGANFEYRNPNMVRNLTGGVSVRVEENKTTEIALTSVIK